MYRCLVGGAGWGSETYSQEVRWRRGRVVTMRRTACHQVQVTSETNLDLNATFTRMSVYEKRARLSLS